MQTQYKTIVFNIATIVGLFQAWKWYTRARGSHKSAIAHIAPVINPSCTYRRRNRTKPKLLVEQRDQVPRRCLRKCCHVREQPFFKNLSKCFWKTSMSKHELRATSTLTTMSKTQNLGLLYDISHEDLWIKLGRGPWSHENWRRGGFRQFKQEIVENCKKFHAVHGQTISKCFTLTESCCRIITLIWFRCCSILT